MLFMFDYVYILYTVYQNATVRVHATTQKQKWLSVDCIDCTLGSVTAMSAHGVWRHLQTGTSL